MWSWNSIPSRNKTGALFCKSPSKADGLFDWVEKSAAVERNRLVLSLLLANIEILDFDSKAAEEYGRVRADLEKRGVPIGSLDMMIAGHARSLGYTVVTNNLKEFSRVSGLKTENWA